LSTIGQEVIEKCHKEGIKFSFDDDCQVRVDGKPCPFAGNWEVDYPINGKKTTLHLCDEHSECFVKGTDVELEIILPGKVSQ